MSEQVVESENGIEGEVLVAGAMDADAVEQHESKSRSRSNSEIENVEQQGEAPSEQKTSDLTTLVTPAPLSSSAVFTPQTTALSAASSASTLQSEPTQPISIKISKRSITRPRKVRRIGDGDRFGEEDDEEEKGELREQGDQDDYEEEAYDSGDTGRKRTRTKSIERTMIGSSTASTQQRQHQQPQLGPFRSQLPSSTPSTPSTTPTYTYPRSSLAPPRSHHPTLLPCRSVYNYTRLNHIEEGTYGIVFRARCNDTHKIFALKKLKLEEEKAGFPITSLREVMALMRTGEHENVVGVREIVVGDTVDQIFIVMPFIEHDLKTLLQEMPNPFQPSEVKTLLMQLLSAVGHCHSNWILHRDLKTSNLLMNNRGQLKVADFGLARTFGDPLGEMTQLVVTLWYRSPELLLGSKAYTTSIDIWSVGCIFGELLTSEPLFQSRGEIDQIGKIFKLLGKPDERNWPGWRRLPGGKNINSVGGQSRLKSKFPHLTEAGHDLLSSLLAYDPDQRVSAEFALRHSYFRESPLPKHPDLFSSFPSHAAGEKRHKVTSPTAPHLHKTMYGRSDVIDLEE